MLEFEPQRKKPHPQVLWQNRALREGRGTGSGSRYRPFIQVRRHDFPSHGLSQILPNPLLNREHHFLSVLEYQIALHALHCGAIDLREQFPLRLDSDDREFTHGIDFSAGTIAIAKRMRIRHPHITQEEPRILTTDMVLTDIDNCDFAVFIRYTKDMPAQGTRQEELLDLQREYWRERSVPFVTLDERSIDPTLIRLLIWAYEGLLHPAGMVTPEFLEFLRQFRGNEPLSWILSQWHEEDGAAFARFKAAIFTGSVTVQTSQRIFPTLTQSWNFHVTKLSQHRFALRDFLEGKRND